MANTNKTKGSDAERWYAKIFREVLGFTHCKTARYGSRLHDDAGIDLINLPMNVQVKAGHQRGMNPGKVITYMQEQIVKSFPPIAPEHKNVNIVIHKRHVGAGKKRTSTDEMVHLTFEDFCTLLKKVDWEK